MTRNGRGTGNVSPPIVTCCSCITSSSADCTFAGARLISSASTKLPNTGPSSVSKRPVSGRYTRVPMRSAGTRSGVNCTRLKVPPRTEASVFTVSVLARPGTPSSSTWPPASSATSSRSSIASWPTITRLISKSASSSAARGSSERWGGAGGTASIRASPLLTSSNDAAEEAERQRGASDQEQQAAAGDGGGDLPLLLLLSELRAESLVDGLEAARALGRECLAARRARDLLERARVGRDALRRHAAAEPLRAPHLDRALRRAECDGVDRDLRLAGDLCGADWVAARGRRPVREQHDRRGRALLSRCDRLVQDRGGRVDRLAGRGAAVHRHARDRGAHGIAVLRRALQYLRDLVERHHAHVHLAGDRREELEAGTLGGVEPARLDVGCGHRA